LEFTKELGDVDAASKVGLKQVEDEVTALEQGVGRVGRERDAIQRDLSERDDGKAGDPDHERDERDEGARCFLEGCGGFLGSAQPALDTLKRDVADLKLKFEEVAKYVRRTIFDLSVKPLHYI
jgi:hypothetical protein